MKYFSKLLAVTLVSGVFPPGVRPQAPAAPPATQKVQPPDYSKESFIIEKHRVAQSFENDGTATQTTTGRVRVQSEAGVQQWGLLSFAYTSANEQLEIGYVRVRKADGTVVETPADSVQDVTSELTRVAPMYSDIHEKHVVVKGLGVGDVLEFQITDRLRTPLIPGQFWFAGEFDKGAIALDEEIEVSVPKGREVKVKSPDLKPDVREEGARRIYTWKSRNTDLKEAEEEAPRQQPPPAILVSSFKSWEEVGRWWNGLEQERVTPTPEIRAKAAELTRNAASRDEKLRAIYNYVATQFRYISISFGIGRFQPHAAAEVLNNQYGDCKDKHTLFSSLLAAAGIEAYPALINSTHRIDPDVPSPGQFDHVITAVPDASQAGKFTWLDTTTEVAPFGLLVIILRDKQALVVPGAGPAAMVTTPADPPFKSFQNYEIDAKLSDAGVLEGKVRREYRGDSELFARAAFRQTPQSNWKDLVHRISQANGFAGEVSDVEVGTPESTGEPFRLSYQYTRKDYPDWANHRISPPFGFIGFAEIGEQKKRTQPVYLGQPMEISEVARVELPMGYAPRLLPAADLVRDFAEYHSKYSFKDGVFTAEVRIVVKKLEVPLTALDDYKSFQKAVSDEASTFTELIRGTEAIPAPTASSSAEATSLFERAREAFRQNDLDSAAEALERAVKLDDHYKDAWMMLASLRMVRGRTNEGLAAFRRVIELDPKETLAYKQLGFAYMAMRRPEEAIPVWRDLLKQDPNEKDAHANLGNILLNLKRYAEAVPELEAAVALNKPSSSLNLALANAYLGAGNKDKAAEIFKKVADASLKPDTWNDVAYTLADNNLSVPEAHGYAEKAVKAVEEEAAHVTLAKLEEADLKRMTELAHYWDTLGWAYFREGDLEKAQKYVEASWNLEQSRVVGEHLADIYEKQGKKAAASHQRSLAEVLPDSEAIRPVLRHRDGTVASRTPARVTAIEEVSAMRSKKLGKLTTKFGSAEFFVLLVQGGKVEDLKFISGEERFRSFGKAIASLKFKAPLPDDAPVKLVRRGVLVCSQYSGCDFTLFPPDSVHSTE